MVVGSCYLGEDFRFLGQFVASLSSGVLGFQHSSCFGSLPLLLLVMVM